MPLVVFGGAPPSAPAQSMSWRRKYAASNARLAEFARLPSHRTRPRLQSPGNIGAGRANHRSRRIIAYRNIGSAAIGAKHHHERMPYVASRPLKHELIGEREPAPTRTKSIVLTFIRRRGDNASFWLNRKRCIINKGERRLVAEKEIACEITGVTLARQAHFEMRR